MSTKKHKPVKVVVDEVTATVEPSVVEPAITAELEDRRDMQAPENAEEAASAPAPEIVATIGHEWTERTVQPGDRVHYNCDNGEFMIVEVTYCWTQDIVNVVTADGITCSTVSRGTTPGTWSWPNVVLESTPIASTTLTA